MLAQPCLPTLLSHGATQQCQKDFSAENGCLPVEGSRCRRGGSACVAASQPRQQVSSSGFCIPPPVAADRRLFSSLASALAASPRRRQANAPCLSPREFRRQSRSLQRRGQLLSRFADLPYVSWRSVLHVLHLLSTKPLLLRGEDLLSLPLVCKRVGITDFRIVDRLLAAAVVRPSTKFAAPWGVRAPGGVAPRASRPAEPASGGASGLSDEPQQQAAPQKDGARRGDRPSFARFVASLDDWRVGKHPHHLHALQRLLAAVSANVHNYSTEDLLLLLDGFTVRSAGAQTGAESAELDVRGRNQARGQVPVEALEEFEATVGILVLQLRAKFVQLQGEAARAGSEAVEKERERLASLPGTVEIYEIISRAAVALPACWESPRSFLRPASPAAVVGAGAMHARTCGERMEGQLAAQRRAFERITGRTPGLGAADEGLQEGMDAATFSPRSATEEMLALLGSKILSTGSASEALSERTAGEGMPAAVDLASLLQASSRVAGLGAPADRLADAAAKEIVGPETPAGRPSGAAPRDSRPAAIAQEILKRLANNTRPTERRGRIEWVEAPEFALSRSLPAERQQALLAACSLAPPAVVPALAAAVWRDFRGCAGGVGAAAAAERAAGTSSGRAAPLALPSSGALADVPLPALVTALPLLARCAVQTVTAADHCAGGRRTGKTAASRAGTPADTTQTRGRRRAASAPSRGEPSSRSSPSRPLADASAGDSLVWLRRLLCVLGSALHQQGRHHLHRKGAALAAEESASETEGSASLFASRSGGEQGSISAVDRAVELFCVAGLGARLSAMLLESKLLSAERRPFSQAVRVRGAGRATPQMPSMPRCASGCRSPCDSSPRLDGWNGRIRCSVVASLHRRYRLAQRLAEMQLRQAVLEAGPLLPPSALRRVVVHSTSSVSAGGGGSSGAGGGRLQGANSLSSPQQGPDGKGVFPASGAAESIHSWLVPHVLHVCPLHMSALYFQLLSAAAMHSWLKTTPAALRRRERQTCPSAGDSNLGAGEATDGGGASGVRAPMLSASASSGDQLALHALRLARHIQQRLNGARRQLERQCRLSQAQQERILISLPQFQQHHEELVLRDRDLDFTPFGKLFNVREPLRGPTSSRDVLALIKQTSQPVSRSAASVRSLLSSLRPLLSPAEDGVSSERVSGNGGRRRACAWLQSESSLREGILGKCNELQMLTDAVARSARRCLYTAIMQMPVRQKAWLGPCQGEVEWATEQAIAMLKADQESCEQSAAELFDLSVSASKRGHASSAGGGELRTDSAHTTGGGDDDQAKGVEASGGGAALTRGAELDAILQGLQPETGVATWDLRSPPRAVRARGRRGAAAHWRIRELRSADDEGQAPGAGVSVDGRIPGVFARLRGLGTSQGRNSFGNQNHPHGETSTREDTEPASAAAEGQRDRFMVLAGSS
ncbi:hypothetical protein BESB_063610 [Besnoitia besnoiti]|uniref:Uncharacterized protein n=1 Tax=Besnoitia besnoiti TaxID=94643 RepID=A0A2A9ME51_BESBE|nr:hypothetical protein BESB_063610 [Besnoitia besnoiti]PFH35474.1 hypothetical protein BESB_063610 [Besnoitia besnoiti]